MRNISNISAVVLGADVNGLGHIRSLGKMGISSIAIGTGGKKDNPDCSSKYCKLISIPRKSHDYELQLVKLLVEISKKQKKKLVLFGTSDYYIDFISKNHEILEDYYLFNIPDTETLNVITSKYSTFKLAKNTGVPTPETVRIKEPGDILQIQQDVGYPCILKPIDSFSSNFPLKNIKFHDEDELREFIKENPDLLNKIIAQEIIDGDELNIVQCTVYIGTDKKIHYFTMQKLHQYPPGYGTTSLGCSKDYDIIKKKTKYLLEGVDYRGFASVEFKKKHNKDDYYLIEINPRLPWYNSMFFSCGVNFPYLALLDLTKHDAYRDLNVEQKNGIHWLHLRNEMRGFFNRIKKGELKDPVQYLNVMIKARTFAYFDLNDLGPFIGANINFLKNDLSKILQKLCL